MELESMFFFQFFYLFLLTDGLIENFFNCNFCFSAVLHDKVGRRVTSVTLDRVSLTTNASIFRSFSIFYTHTRLIKDALATSEVTLHN